MRARKRKRGRRSSSPPHAKGRIASDVVAALEGATAQVQGIIERPAPVVDIPELTEPEAPAEGGAGQSEEEILANDPDPSSQATDEASAPASEVPIPGTPHTVVNDPDIQRPADATEADSTDSGTPKDLLDEEDVVKDETDESGDTADTGTGPTAEVTTEDSV
jgi:hypothetical protein